MLLNDLSEPDFRLLDGACDGMLSQLRDRFDNRVSLTIQTHHDGLPQGVMKLYITVEGEQERAVARLGGSLIMLGWDIYLRDLTQSVRSDLKRMNQRIQQVEAITGPVQVDAPSKSLALPPQSAEIPLWTDEDLSPARTLH